MIVLSASFRLWANARSTYAFNDGGHCLFGAAVADDDAEEDGPVKEGEEEVAVEGGGGRGMGGTPT